MVIIHISYMLYALYILEDEKLKRLLSHIHILLLLLFLKNNSHSGATAISSYNYSHFLLSSPISSFSSCGGWYAFILYL